MWLTHLSLSHFWGEDDGLFPSCTALGLLRAPRAGMNAPEGQEEAVPWVPMEQQWD